jgi:hypothetical protein
MFFGECFRSMAVVAVCPHGQVRPAVQNRDRRRGRRLAVIRIRRIPAKAGKPALGCKAMPPQYRARALRIFRIAALHAIPIH